MYLVESCYEKGIRLLQVVFKPLSKRAIKEKEKEIQNLNTNMDFTLIVHTCIGGVIYHRLGLRFNSPTINLWLYLEDYVKLCMDLERYMNTDIVFVDSDKKYPVGMIDDITVYFEHYKTNDDARIKWNERKARINYDNLYGIAMLHSIEDYEIVKPLLDNQKFKKVCCLSNVKVNDSRITYIKPNGIGNNRLNYLDKNVLGFRSFEKSFDYISFLNDNR